MNIGFHHTYDTIKNMPFSFSKMASHCTYRSAFINLLSSLHITCLRPTRIPRYGSNTFLSTTLAAFLQVFGLSPAVRKYFLLWHLWTRQTVHTCEYAKLKQKSHQIVNHTTCKALGYFLICFTLCYNPLSWFTDPTNGVNSPSLI